MTLFEPDPGPPPAAPSGRLVRVRLVVAYDGAGFAGFAPNPGVRTVGGTLATTLARVLRVPSVEVTGAGRTDAGVHAWGQVVTFDAPLPDGGELDLARLQRSVNALCAPAIVVRSAELAPSADFDARFSARWRSYRYTVLNRPVPDPFLAATSWHVPQPLDLADMTLACDPFIGEHDFSAFCKRPRGVEPPPSMVRRVFEARWDDDGDGVLRFRIRANAFCHNMVRSIVGLLVEVGLGKRRAGEVAGVIRSKDRSRAGPVAPPHGLCLWEVGY